MIHNDNCDLASLSTYAPTSPASGNLITSDPALPPLELGHLLKYCKSKTIEPLCHFDSIIAGYRFPFESIPKAHFLGDKALNWIDWTLIMLKSMMQPPESKLSSVEVFVLILMPVLLGSVAMLAV